MYPSKEEFEQILRTGDLDHLLDEYLFTGLPFSFADDPKIHERLIGTISRGTARSVGRYMRSWKRPHRVQPCASQIRGALQ